MNPKQFLLIGGLVLAVVGILGFVGVIGPTAEQSIFGSAWWVDNAENWAHLVLGIVALLAWKMLSASNQKILVILVGILGLLVGLYNFTSTSLLGANLENPADLALHLVVGLWALYAGLSKRGAMTA
ncbi:MAG: hypothetical protein HYY99_00405 [Candidatus Colwellbacteria bacterium]|nr:hypothetical protein [Candidatus Colwellbacteria bacterium]